MLNSRKLEIRKKADYFSGGKCRLSRYGIIDLFKECERLGYKLFRYPLGESADLGFTVKRDSDIVIFTNSCSRLSREIFTLAHEIGHVTLHLTDTASFIDDTVTITGRSTDANRRQNYFAACLLMPSESGTDSLIWKFRISAKTDYRQWTLRGSCLHSASVLTWR